MNVFTVTGALYTPNDHSHTVQTEPDFNNPEPALYLVLNFTVRQ